jgi:Plastocyanin-like domain
MSFHLILLQGFLIIFYSFFTAFTYPANQDTVLLVDSNAYNSCDASSPIDRFADGNTVFTLTRSGPFYFISGNQDNCKKGEKLHIVVLANRSNSTGSAPSPSPSPPAEAPSSSSPPSPPSGEGEITPSTSTTPPPSAASLHTIGLMGMLGLVFVPFLNILV